jgi:hypothetical protein
MKPGMRGARETERLRLLWVEPLDSDNIHPPPTQEMLTGRCLFAQGLAHVVTLLTHRTLMK